VSTRDLHPDLPEDAREEASIDQLFAAPLKTFVAERKRLADRLKASGNPGAAKKLAKTPRPSVSAWIVNQMARQDGPLLRDFAELTDRLRGAQGQIVHAKPGEGASELLAEHRAAIKRLRGRAEEILRASGQAVRPPILDRVLRNLRVGMADVEVRPTIESGRLLEDVAAEEGFAGLFGRSVESAEEPRHDPRAGGESDSRAPAHSGEGASDLAARRAAVEVARAAAARAAEETKARARVQAERARARGEAEVRLRTLQARADGARRSLEKAQRNVEAARQALAQAEDDLRSAQVTAEGCAKQVADAQAELESPP
jgi:hypothetical protein